MPVRIPDHLPAAGVLRSENIFVMTETRAATQDIRPMKVLILNLMPDKIETETQLLRLLGNTPLQINVELLRIHNKVSVHTPIGHMNSFYRDFVEVKDNNYDGLIITGAPLGHIPYEQVTFWEKFCEILDWSETHVTSTMFLCWAAHAGLYYSYGLQRQILPSKRVGVFCHQRTQEPYPLLRGFDDEIYAPHSRYAEIPLEKITTHAELNVLASSPEAGAYLVLSKDNRKLFITGHPEYHLHTLKNEYLRDIKQGLQPDLPCRYFVNDDPKASPICRWSCHANLLFNNWLNYYVYQLTPYDLANMQAITPWESD